jgi:hypothetical protein
MKPGDVAQIPSANSSANTGNNPAPYFDVVAIDFQIIAEKMAVGQLM